MHELWMGVLPVAGLSLASCILILLAVFVRHARAIGVTALLLTLFLGGGPVVWLWRLGGVESKAALLSSVPYALFFDALFILAALFSMALCMDYFRRKGRKRPEVYPLIGFSTAGMMVLASATHLITFYLGLELMSICFYVLAGAMREHENSVEASLKYFILGAFSSAFLLLGAAFLYGSTGDLSYSGLAGAFANGIYNFGTPVMLAGFFLFLAGLFFKLSLIPFHFWAPDVYQGAPTPVTALMAVGGKTAALAAAVRLGLEVFSRSAVLAHRWYVVFLVLGLITIFAGAMIAMTQRHMKRLLAYSSIVHAGFLALGLAGLGLGGDLARKLLGALLFYAAAYLFMNIGAFAVAGLVERPGNQDEPLSTFYGLGTRSPVLAALFALFMFSLAGIPLTGGFLAKFYLFRGLVSGHLYWTAALGLAGAVIATYYYLKVIVGLYFSDPVDPPDQIARGSWSTWTVLLLAGAVTLYLGLFPGLLSQVASGLVLH
jgi:NADH-quinone oxidoreductase subunit N